MNEPVTPRARTPEEEAHAIAWQCTGEMSRQVALIWHLVSGAMPMGRERAMIANAVSTFGSLAYMQDDLMAQLTPGRPPTRLDTVASE
jgi:hypothetical protein